MIDLIIDAFWDTCTLVPYLFLTYLLLEYIEHRTLKYSLKAVANKKMGTPILGAFLGMVPQCGFSVVGANLYATGLITLGTLIAIFLSTSDEMVPILLSEGAPVSLIVGLLFLKGGYAAICGIFLDIFLKKTSLGRQPLDIEAFCHRTHCHCHTKKSIVWAAGWHTFEISCFLFGCAFILQLIFAYIFPDITLSKLQNFPIFSVFTTAAIGLIPSCYPSVLLTKLFLAQSIGLGALIAGTLCNAGMGMLVLYKTLANRKNVFVVGGIMYGLSVCLGLLLTYVF